VELHLLILWSVMGNALDGAKMAISLLQTSAVASKASKARVE
jgi:hypothetical protein